MNGWPDIKKKQKNNYNKNSAHAHAHLKNNAICIKKKNSNFYCIHINIIGKDPPFPRNNNKEWQRQKQKRKLIILYSHLTVHWIRARNWSTPPPRNVDYADWET